MHYVYHPDHEPKIVSTVEYQEHLQRGWFDTPTKFPEKLEGKEPKEKKQNEKVLL